MPEFGFHSQTNLFFLLFFSFYVSIVSYSTWERKIFFKYKNTSSASILITRSQLYSYPYIENITYWILGYQGSVAPTKMMPRDTERWNDATNRWLIKTELQYSLYSMGFL